MMCRRAAVVVLVAGVLLPAAGGVAATKPVQVHCGQIIRADTKVANDLQDCPDIGLAIGASNITLDLNRHTIDGDGTFVEDCPEEEPCDSGITNCQLDGTEVVNGPGFPGVTIRNGTVRDFPGVGVYEFGVSGNRL